MKEVYQKATEEKLRIREENEINYNELKQLYEEQMEKQKDLFKNVAGDQDVIE